MHLLRIVLTTLFLGFSIFLVVASLLLVGLFFRLAIEQRLAQLGVLRAMGYSLKAVRGLVLREGLLVAAVGGSLGIVLAMLWAGLMMYGLGTWSVGAVGTACMSIRARSRTGGAQAWPQVGCRSRSRFAALVTPRRRPC